MPLRNCHCKALDMRKYSTLALANKFVYEAALFSLASLKARASWRRAQADEGLLSDLQQIPTDRYLPPSTNS